MMTKENWGFENTYETLPAIFYTNVALNEVEQPEIVIWNEPLARKLDMTDEKYQDADVLGGNEFPEDAAQLAQSYAGHQFGRFNILGDGRALLIGEKVVNGQRYDLQLKGSGPTPYSRAGDGRAALGPMLREYIISEAMHGLGIPTTRSLAVVTTGEIIYRETILKGAILTRVAKSHLRVGTFAFAARFSKKEELKALADYAIVRHDEDLIEDVNKYERFLERVIERQAQLIAKWQLVGFIHGVMNTDNMTISGETIDYGPCAFMDEFDPDTVFSSIDTDGRYAFGNQPNIGGWNLTRFAEALIPLLAEDEQAGIEIAKQVIKKYPERFTYYYQKGLQEKLGMKKLVEGDNELAVAYLQLLMKYDVDYTNSFRALTKKIRPAESMFVTNDFKEWEQKWLTRLAQEDRPMDQIFKEMDAINPAIIARNHQVEKALEMAVEGDYTVLHELVDLLQNPYVVAEQYEAYTKPKEDDEPYQTYCGT